MKLIEHFKQKTLKRQGRLKFDRGNKFLHQQDAKPLRESAKIKMLRIITLSSYWEGEIGVRAPYNQHENPSMKISSPKNALHHAADTSASGVNRSILNVRQNIVA